MQRQLNSAFSIESIINSSDQRNLYQNLNRTSLLATTSASLPSNTAVSFSASHQTDFFPSAFGIAGIYQQQNGHAALDSLANLRNRTSLQPLSLTAEDLPGLYSQLSGD